MRHRLREADGLVADKDGDRVSVPDAVGVLLLIECGHPVLTADSALIAD
jgi:hypothetical protein